MKNVDYTLENVEVKANERRQVFDIPPVNLVVTEYKSQIIDLPLFRKINKALFPESVTYPVQYGPNFLSSVIYYKSYQFITYERICKFLDYVIRLCYENKDLSCSIIRAERECFRNFEKFENVSREKLITSSVIQCDEIGLKFKKKDVGFM